MRMTSHQPFTFVTKLHVLTPSVFEMTLHSSLHTDGKAVEAVDTGEAAEVTVLDPVGAAEDADDEGGSGGDV